MDVAHFLDMWVRADRQNEPEIRPESEPVESEGVMWDPNTGCKVSNVFVSGFTQFRKRTFSRYSRRARFMTEVMGMFTNNTYIQAIMAMFDRLLGKWKTARKSLVRVYFLNVRCVLFMICEHLNIPPPYPKEDCLRDVKRFERQKELFKQFV